MLDPKDLNRALQRENYPMPTIEEVASRLHGAKVFPLLDVSNGFWHVVLDAESSFCTTFNTPFGRYRWKRMPFGIRSAPEVFQRKMHELIEGLRVLRSSRIILFLSVMVNRDSLQIRTMTGIFYRFFRDVMSAEFIGIATSYSLQ